MTENHGLLQIYWNWVTETWADDNWTYQLQIEFSFMSTSILALQPFLQIKFNADWGEVSADFETEQSWHQNVLMLFTAQIRVKTLF